MRVLVTGAAGFIGGNAVRTLAARGSAVFAHMGRRGGAAPAGAVALGGDIADGTAGWPQVDLVFHAAGQDQYSGVSDEVLTANNTRSTRAVADYARRSGARVVFLSAVSAYGAVTAPVVTADTPPRAPEAYGASKLACERILAEAAGDGVTSLVVRIPGVVGPGAWTCWLARTLARLRADEPVAIYAAEAMFNNVVHVADLALFVDRLGRVPLPRHDVVLVGAAEPMAIRDLVHTLKSEVKSKSTITEHPAPRPPFILSSEKAEKMYGYRPAPVLDILRRFVRDGSIDVPQPNV